MKTKSWKPLLLGALATSLAFTACEEEKPNDTNTTVTQDVDTTTVSNIDPGVYYSVPTPNELFNVLKLLKMPFNAELMNDPANVENYTESTSQALNFGVYSADLAMAASFNEGVNTLALFKTIRKLSESLNISSAFDEAVFKRIEENMNSGQTDSLTVLSNETYYDAYSYLEENQRGSTLALMVVGGWVESLYIMANSGEFVEGSEFSKRLADQKLTMENLMGFLMEYQDNEDVMVVMEELIPLDEFFMNLEMIEGDAVTTAQEDGVYILSGGSEAYISKEDFATLKTLVSDLRMSIINAEI
ncbi:MAG: hypothetical protein H6598_02860 [Flavobacteriales bacterium]|nr:hypothetical protein [Flavobacteriales bacterium]